MLMRTDPFRELDRLAQSLVGASTPGTWSRPSAMPIDAYRAGDEFVVMFDLPGVTPDAIEVDVERNVLTVKAERRPTVHEGDVEMQVSERPLGVFSLPSRMTTVDQSDRDLVPPADLTRPHIVR